MDPYPVLNPYLMLENWNRIMDQHPPIESFKEFEEAFNQQFIEKEKAHVRDSIWEQGTEGRDDQSAINTDWALGDKDLFGDYVCRPSLYSGGHQHVVKDRFGGADGSQGLGRRA